MISNKLKLGQAIEAETKTYIDSLSVRPSQAEITNIDRLIKRLKHYDIWNLLDLLYLFLGGNENDSKVNARNPGTYDLTKVNSPRFTANRGWNSNSAGHLDTGFNASLLTGKLQLNSASIGVAVLESVGTNAIMGTAGSGGISLNPRRVLDTFLIRSNSSGTVSITHNGIGLHATTRVNSSTVRLFRRGDPASSSSSVLATTSMVSQNILILAITPGSYAVGVTVPFAFAGAGLTGLQMFQLNKAFANYAAFYGVASS